ncbi:MAG TPA: cysteine--tRNA ligase, partial [Acidimicrobiia bacterium]|nr:cysteine--tRNA ligase [Acidimicrobiia bacterium]
VRLFDTAHRKVVPFEPGPVVRMYVCGITPYDSTHLGHAATYLAYDLLVRRLEDLGHEVRMVRNVTDVDDSILPKARELGIPYLELAESELARFHSDMEALEMRPPVAEPRATEAIPGIVHMVNQLLDSGHAYLTHGTVYFDVSTFPRFGELSHYSADHMVRLARARGGKPDDPHRRDPLDFVLWQPSLADEPAWRAPFGVGRPGWHVECSVMAMENLGGTLDLHGGGTDLIFPHHECEIAQSESITGVQFSRHWMHSAMVNYEGEKMSKSLGNLVFVSDLVKAADPRAIRLALLRHHYRSGLEWYDTDLEEGNALLHRLLAAAERDDGPDPRPFAAAVRDALDDDLDTPRALDTLDDLASAILSGGGDTSAPGVFRDTAALLGLDLARPIGVAPD